MRALHVLAVLLCSLVIVAWCVTAAFCAELAALYDGSAAAPRNAQGQLASSYLSSIDASYSRLNRAAGYSLVFEAAVLTLTAAGFLLFFPACIVMFNRVEHRLASILKEMDHRSDVGCVFLPFEFSPPAARTLDRTQVERAPDQTKCNMIIENFTTRRAG